MLSAAGLVSTAVARTAKRQGREAHVALNAAKEKSDREKMGLPDFVTEEEWPLLRAQAEASVDFSKELGATAPLGFWDPIRLRSWWMGPIVDTNTLTGIFRRRRVIEIQHGRIAMLACIGYIVPEFVRWPGYLSPSLDLKFSDVPNGLGALSIVPIAGWMQIVTFCAILEITTLSRAGEPTEYPGAVDGFGAFGIPFGPRIEDKQRKEKSLVAELNNGRLAMFAIIGMFFQNGLTGSAWGDWSSYVDSPLR